MKVTGSEVKRFNRLWFKITRDPSRYKNNGYKNNCKVRHFLKFTRPVWPIAL